MQIKQTRQEIKRDKFISDIDFGETFAFIHGAPPFRTDVVFMKAKMLLGQVMSLDVAVNLRDGQLVSVSPNDKLRLIDTEVTVFQP